MLFIINKLKYPIIAHFPIIVIGYSIILVPNHVNINIILIKIHFNFLSDILFLLKPNSNKCSTNHIPNPPPINIIPPNLLLIDLNIPYVHNKYICGIIFEGVITMFASLLLSISPNGNASGIYLII